MHVDPVRRSSVYAVDGESFVGAKIVGDEKISSIAANKAQQRVSTTSTCYSTWQTVSQHSESHAQMQTGS